MIDRIIGHYRILEKLGQGGMGVVYKAEDMRLQRTVALKFLSGEFSAGGAELERFLREARAASALNHPNVATIYAVEEAGDEMFIAMEYVDGVTLRHRIADGSLTADEVIGFAVQIAEALREAHAKGIVHRDIKCDNIMVNSRGNVKVMDFGLAKLKGIPGMTRSGETAGTIAFMAPEQLQGLPADTRSDMFSFGVVLYEMVTGRRPFRGEHEAAIMYSLLHENPPAPSSLRPDLPPAIETVIRKSLEKDPARRYQTVDELLRDLRSTGGPAPSGGSRDKSIAVLPFDNISPDKENEYFSDGLTEEIIANLSKVRTLKVVSRTSVMRFKATTKSLREIAHELQTRYILEGSVRKHANDLRITAQLIDAADDSHLWTETYRGTIADVFDIQEKVAGEIVHALRVTLTDEEHLELRKRRTEDTEAYQHFLRGRFHWNKRTEADVRKGIEHFEEAIRIDPGFALAYVGLADGFNILGFYSFSPPREVFPRAKDAARKALALDRNLSEGHASLAYALHYFDWNWTEAEREFQKAIELNPEYPTAPHFYANFLVAMGRFDEAIASFARARELDPLSMIINQGMAWAFYFARRYDDAIAQSRRTLELDNSFAVGHQWLARAYVQAGKLDEAIAEFTEALALSGRDPVVLSELAHAYACTGQRSESEKLLGEMESLRTRRYVSPYLLADVSVAYGDPDAAFAWLQKSLDDRCRELVLLNVEPRLDPLRSDPRFTSLLLHVGLS